MARDKVRLDIVWLRDESLEDSANLPEPDVLAAQIVADLQAALEQFAALPAELETGDDGGDSAAGTEPHLEAPVVASA